MSSRKQFMEETVLISAALFVFGFFLDKPTRIWPFWQSSDLSEVPSNSALIVQPETGRVFAVPALADLDRALLLRRSKDRNRTSNIEPEQPPLGPFSRN